MRICLCIMAGVGGGLVEGQSDPDGLQGWCGH